MATVENEHFLRSVLLLSDGGSYITKEIVHRELPKYGGNLDALLSSNTKKIENEFKKNRKQIEKLFPASGQTDLNTWDIQMLTGIILVLFRSDLEPEEKSQIREIRYVRHELAHSPSAALYEDNYKDVKERLAFAITTLASRFATSVQDNCKELISKYESCSLDVTASLKRLKEKQHTDELFEKILEKIKQLDEKLSKDIEESTSQICQTITDTSQETADKIDAVEGGICTAVANTEQTLSGQIQIVKADLKSDITENHRLLLAVLEELNRKRQIQPFERIRSIVNSKLTFSGEEEVVDLADKIILTVINAALKRTQGSTEMERIRRAVDDILEEFDKLEGVKVLSAEPQCIIVGFHCDNYKSLYDLLTYITSQSYQKRLGVIAEAVSSYLHKPLTLHSDITSACLHSILDEMGTTHSIKQRSILLPIQCDTIEGLENVRKIFESDVLSKKLDKLSDALSEELAGKVSVDAELNEVYIKEDKEIEHISQQKENDLPVEEHKSLDVECYGEGNALSEDHSYKKERQSLLREQKSLPTQHKKESAKDTSSQDTKLIVAAIDVGTTFTTYAYSYGTDYDRDHLKIYTYDDWKNAMGISSSKTPTAVLFDESGQFHSFGYEAEIKFAELMEEDTDEHNGWKYFRDLTLNLQRNQAYVLLDNKNNTMPALDVYAAVLKYLKDHLLNILSFRLFDPYETDIHWVISVPVSWFDREIELLAGAAEKACLSNDRITFASKPEMAAIYCKELLASKVSEYRKKEEMKNFSPGAQFLVLDAGGQTVNVTALEVQSNGTMTEILHSDVLSPIDGSWGGCLVDSKLKTFLQSLFGANVMEIFSRECYIDALELQHSTEIMKRQCIDPENEKDDFRNWISVPATLLDIFNERNNSSFTESVAEHRLAMNVQARRNKLYVSNDFVTELYKETKQKLTSHLREIFRNNPELKSVKTIIMIGGLANSEILRNEIKLSFPSKRVVVPDDASVAIVKGAVMFGFNTKMFV